MTPHRDSSRLVVLFADIAGSTRLYEQHGDELARDSVSQCVDLLTEVAMRFDGRLVKTIGDEIMCRFSEPVGAVLASNEMQFAVRREGAASRFATGALRIKVGLHLGPALEESEDIVGEASMVAAQIVKLAKADQILTSGATVAELPESLRLASRRLDRLPLSGAAQAVDIYELIWEVSGLTQVADMSPERARITHERLAVAYGAGQFEVNEACPSLTMGRVQGNDVVVPSDLTSRNHAVIEYRRGRFYLEDNSSNGTTVITDGGSAQVLRRDRTALVGSGRICLGGDPDRNPVATLRYRCE